MPDESGHGCAVTHRSVGVGIALILLVASGAGYRATAARLSSAHAMVPLARGTLSVLPVAIGEWAGEDVPLDASVIGRTDTDDHVNRTYTRGGGPEAVSLFIGYGIRMRDLMPHRPEVCYTGAGWTLEDSRPIELTLADGSVLPCGIQTFHRFGAQTGRVAVLNYYIVDGVYSADVSLLRSRVWRFDADVKYVAQVQMAGTVGPMGASGRKAVQDFAVDSAPVIRDMLRKAVDREASRIQP